MNAIHAIASASVLAMGGAAGVKNRLALCADLLDQQKRRNTPFDRDSEKARAQALIDRRISAIRAILLPGWKPEGPSLVDVLLSPSMAKPALMAQLEAAKAMPAHDSAAAGYIAQDLERIVLAFANAEFALGLSNRKVGMPEVAKAAQALMPADDDSAPTWQKGFTAARPVVLGSIAAGALSTEQQALWDKHAAILLPVSRDWTLQYPDLVATWLPMQTKLQALLAERGAVEAKYKQEAQKRPRNKEKLAHIESLYIDLSGQIRKLQTEFDGPNDQALEAFNQVKNARKEASEIVQKAIIDPLMEASPVSAEQAKDWSTQNIKIDAAASRRLNTLNYPAEQLRQDAAAFFRLTKGLIDKITISVDDKGRAYAGNIKDHGKPGLIAISNAFDRRILWHEMGHHIEADPAAAAASQLYIRMRSKDGAVLRLDQLKPNASYKPDELTFNADFFDPYVSKIYGGVTEVFSMAMESFSDPVLLLDRQKRDPELFAFVMGYINSPSTVLKQMHQAMRQAMRGTNDSMDASADGAFAAKIKALAKRIHLEPDQSDDWMIGNRQSWMVYDLANGKLGTVKVGDKEIHIYNAKVIAPKTGRKVPGYAVFWVVEGGYMEKLQIPMRNREYLMAYLSKVVEQLQADWERSPIWYETFMRDLA